MTPDKTTLGWHKTSDGYYRPSGLQVDRIEPNVYKIQQDSMGIYFEPVPVNPEPLIIEGTACNEIVNHIFTFWQKEDVFHRHNLNYKRGVLLYGVPGGGKSCLVRIICEDVIKRNGVVFLLGNPCLFEAAYIEFRKIETDTPIVVVIEDLDYLADCNEEELTGMLDGILRLHKVVFIATSNYFDKLSQRLIRPSRFDLLVEIGLPSLVTRREYINHLSKGDDVKGWVEKTDGLTFADIKELFISVNVLGLDFDETYKRLVSRKKEDKKES